MKSPTLDRVVGALLESAVLGGKMCRAERLRSRVSFKPFDATSAPYVSLASGIVTSADLTVQEAILGCLLQHGFHDCAIQAEEDTPTVQRFNNARSVSIIYIDPIDGTLAYSMGCPGWEDAALSAGFNQKILDYSRERIDTQLYGMVLGASVPGSGIASVCSLPEVGITYHSLHDVAFRNGTEIGLPSAPTMQGRDWTTTFGRGRKRIYSFCHCRLRCAVVQLV